jgi:hypothetical protein
MSVAHHRDIHVTVADVVARAGGSCGTRAENSVPQDARGFPMTTTTYFGATADERLAEAQRTLNTHATSSATGRCLTCGTPGPCYKRENAVGIFSRTLRLPRRHPGATRPELMGARRIDGNGLRTGAA